MYQLLYVHYYSLCLLSYTLSQYHYGTAFYDAQYAAFDETALGIGLLPTSVLVYIEQTRTYTWLYIT